MRELAIKHGFGHEVDIQAVKGEGAAGYCAKYVSKSADDRDELPWVDRATGERLRGVGRYRPWSSSRRWSALTMAAIRAEQSRWAREQIDGDRDDGRTDGRASGHRPPAGPPPPTGAGPPARRPLDLKTGIYTTTPTTELPSDQLLLGVRPALRLEQATDRWSNELEKGAGAWFTPGTARVCPAPSGADRGIAALTDSVSTRFGAPEGETRP